MGRSRLYLTRVPMHLMGWISLNKLRPNIITKVGVSKYRPHYGAKEAAKYATRAPHRLGG